MSAINVTATQVSPVDIDKAQIYDAIAAVAITAGQSVYVNASGKLDLASTSAAGKHNTTGVALKSVAAGMPCPYQYRGPVGGFDLSGLAFGATVYQSDTAGALDTAAGTVAVPVGKVVPTTQLGNIGKVLHLDVDMRTTY